MSNPIRSIVEDRLTAYLATGMTGIDIAKGVTAELRTLPMIIVHAEGAYKPSSFGSDNFGNFRVTVKVYVYTSADDETLEKHRERVSDVKGLLVNKSALKTFWGASNGSVYEIAFDSDNEAMEGRKFGTMLEYTMFCVLPPAP
jgi:hypothetical protein